MPRYRLTIEYDGTPYVGWQTQENGRAVQQVLEEGVFGFTGERVRVFGSGRTDAGVHARGQVAHIDLAKDWPLDTVRDAMNYHMRPEPVAVLAAERVDETFDARFSAVQRHYLYRMVDRRAPLTLEARQAWLVHRPLVAEAMHEAAQVFLGLHDFSTFRASECQAKSPIRTIDAISVTRVGPEVHLQVAARAFLHNQIRSFAGTLKLVGEGKWGAGDVRSALDAKNRKACGPVAPPQGLYFMQVDYGVPSIPPHAE